MKRLSFPRIALILTFLLSITTFISPASAQVGVVAAVEIDLTLRVGPGTEWRQLGIMPAGTNVRLDGRDFSGLWARGITQNGEAGWMAARYLSVGEDAIFALPVIDREAPITVEAPPPGAVPVTAPQASAEGEQAAPVAPVPPPIVSNTPVTGFSYGGHVRGLDEITVNYMRIAGMTWAKYQVRYTQGDDPNAVAGLINDTHAKGFRILLGVVGLPGQLNNGGYFDAYAGYVAGLAGLGADAIEIWNEPNIDREWPTGQVDPAMYTSLLATSYNAIKSVNANTLVITGAPAPTGFFGGCSANGCDDNVYIAGMAAAGAANYADCIGVHYNEGIVPPTQNFGDPRSEYYTRYYNGMVNTYYNAFGGRRPLCFTELGYLTPEGFPPLPGGFAWAQNVTVAQQASWLDQVMNMSRNSGRVRLVIVWNVNFTNYGEDPMAGYAMIRPDGTCPACTALGN